MADSFVDIFQQLKTILCLCPNCSSLLRVSQLHLRFTAPAPRTWLDDYDDQIKKLQIKSDSVATKEDKLYSQETEMRKKSSERGQKRVVGTVLKSMDDYFSKKKYNPYDIKPIIHPVDFVIFNGDHDKQVNEVVFLSKKSKNPNLAALQKSVDECVEKKNYDFKTAKISNEGKVTFV
jgi:predicted Holliday junction resolvase-like endonuclease